MPTRSRTLAIMAAASVGGSLLVVGNAPPAAAVELGTVTYAGTVSCETRYKTPDKSVPTKVKLSSGKAEDRNVTDGVDNDGARTADYGPADLVVPLDSKFQLRIAVTCKAPGQKAKTFNRSIEQRDLADEQEIKLDIK